LSELINCCARRPWLPGSNRTSTPRRSSDAERRSVIQQLKCNPSSTRARTVEVEATGHCAPRRRASPPPPAGRDPRACAETPEAWSQSGSVEGWVCPGPHDCRYGETQGTVVPLLGRPGDAGINDGTLGAAGPGFSSGRVPVVAAADMGLAARRSGPGGVQARPQNRSSRSDRLDRDDSRPTSL
jgi:hypothetical protein